MFLHLSSVVLKLHFKTINGIVENEFFMRHFIITYKLSISMKKSNECVKHLQRKL